MPSSSPRRALALVALLAVTALASRAGAQQAQGFAVERFYPSSPGGGWFVMDDLDLHGGLGGVMSVTAGYAMKPLRIPDGAGHLDVVSDQAFTDFGFAATYDRYRLTLNMDAPLVIRGHGGVASGATFTAPAVDLTSNPDTLADPRLGLDARLLGEASGPLRLGASAQLVIPNGRRADYDTDGTLRAMGRLLVAGDLGPVTYAGHVGVHVRPLDDGPVPGSPRGSELLFGAAAGARLPVSFGSPAALVVGPEVFGASALRSLMGGSTTDLEALLSARLEGTAPSGPQLRVRLGTGAGLNQQFGAPEWRLVFGIELFDHGAVRAAP